MTPQQRTEAARYLKAFDFSGLFTDPSIGWDWPASGNRLKVPTVQGVRELEVIAEKKGVKVLLVPPLANGSIMPSEERKRLEVAVTPLAAEHLLIFTDRAKTRQIWLWTTRLPGKPIRRRELNWEKGHSNELLLQKVISIAFTLDEEEALDITGVVHRLHDNLDRDKLTGKFYKEFKVQKDQFQGFITGLSDQDVTAHYTSLMLNRLMFCYFLQQKGFLDGDEHYLKNRFDRVREILGKDQYHSFYMTFLKRLFQDGLDSQPPRSDKLTAIIGKNIPYLNGGIFAEHKIEKDHPNIQIPDQAFEKIFAFFDAYDWHLDDRPLANGNEINPEVLGYVFEKYTNQKEMGAYYTKEDITSYISKNTILPFLLQKVAAKLPADAWDLLKNDPDRYIYEPVRRGAAAGEKEWKKSLPKDIASGLDTKAPDLLDRRKDWNNPAPASHALPTEIWRETIARHQRCHELRKRLRAGEIKAPADLVTLNLDIRQFVQDIIATAPADLALALWKALRSISVLDPTCGSGAFLFAALEILEPLYGGLLERLRAHLADWQSSGEKHPLWQKEIQLILAAVDRHLNNEAYFIHKTIIVHNLYGVDIMEEAVEICKLRLFLKLAAQLEPGQAVEPLPDIDFNIRSGNTLVGYASRDEIKRAVENDSTLKKQVDGREQGMLLATVADTDAFTQIMEQAEDADRAFRRFQDLQDTLVQSAAEFRSAKTDLQNTLASLRARLDRFLAAQYDQRNIKSDASLKKWQTSHEPFHWFVEFYGIMNSGGFDVIVGNPPYVEYRDVRSKYRILGYETESCGDLYGYTMERAYRISSNGQWLGMIVPISIFGLDGFSTLQALTRSCFSSLWCSFYSNRPSQLFDGAQKRLTIVIGKRGNSQGSIFFTSRYHRWLKSEFDNLFKGQLEYGCNSSPFRIFSSSLEKTGSNLQTKCLEKITARSSVLEIDLQKRSEYPVYYTRKFGYFLAFLDTPPKVRSIKTGTNLLPTELKEFWFNSSKVQSAAIAALSSSCFFWFWNVLSDCRNLNRRDLTAFPWAASKMDQESLMKLSKAGVVYLKKLKATSHEMEKSGLFLETFEYRKNKDQIDQIDTILAEHYGFTPEELDFIINYDIKYRMGLGGGSAEEEEE